VAGLERWSGTSPSLVAFHASLQFVVQETYGLGG